MKRWMRFNFMDPIPLLDNATGKRIGKSQVFLRAVRSDNFLYQVNVTANDVDLETAAGIESVHRELRCLLEPYLNDDPSGHVTPMQQEEPFKSVQNWMEATVN